MRYWILSSWLLVVAIDSSAIAAIPTSIDSFSIVDRDISNTSTWLDRGRDFYRRGQFSEAASQWERGIDPSQKAAIACNWRWLLTTSV